MVSCRSLCRVWLCRHHNSVTRRISGVSFCTEVLTSVSWPSADPRHVTSPLQVTNISLFISLFGYWNILISFPTRLQLMPSSKLIIWQRKRRKTTSRFYLSDIIRHNYSSSSVRLNEKHCLLLYILVKIWILLRLQKKMNFFRNSSRVFLAVHFCRMLVHNLN